MDEINKSVWVGARMSFAVTGEAYIGSEPTPAWFANRLREAGRRGHSVFPALDEIATELTTALGRRRTRGRPLAIVGGGWEYDGPNPKAFYAEISNLPPTSPARDEFVRAHFVPPAGAFGVFAAGQQVASKRLLDVRRTIKEASARGTTLGVVERLLVDTIRDIADCNPLVGYDLLLSRFPRPPTEQERQDGKDYTGMEFTYLPEDISRVPSEIDLQINVSVPAFLPPGFPEGRQPPPMVAYFRIPETLRQRPPTPLRNASRRRKSRGPLIKLGIAP